jgi:quinol monooxygenase YgiN
MFARIIEITPKLEKKEELIQTIRQEVLPILKQQPGFLELLPFVPEAITEKFLAISLWTEKHDAEKYVRHVLPQIEQIVKPYMAVPFKTRPYNVETTLCEHLVEVLTVAA